jgi:hypothetical protein
MSIDKQKTKRDRGNVLGHQDEQREVKKEDTGAEGSKAAQQWRGIKRNKLVLGKSGLYVPRW